ncbi:MAG: phosphatase PAP2 family protein [Wujia sp.]
MSIEIKILDWLQTIRTPILDKIIPVISSLGNAGFVWLLLMVILLLIPKTRKSGLILLFALVVDLILCNGVLKNLFARTRPFDVNTSITLLIKRPGEYSFPSGHTASSFAAVSALFLAREKKLWKPALVLAILIAFTRLYLYVHYPTDILGGMLVGILSGYIGYKIVMKICHKSKKIIFTEDS